MRNRASFCTMVVGVAAVSSACSLFNEFDRDRLDFDAGMDGSIDGGVADADASDAHVDAGDGCVGSTCAELEDCTDGMDNDLDGLVDCLDFECAGAPECCESGDTLFEEDWDPVVDFRLSWNEVPSTQDTFPVRTTSSGSSYIQSFGDGSFPVGVIHKTCTPMSYGIEAEAQFEPKGEASCMTSPCSEFAGLVLTAATDAVQGNRILDELAVTVDALGLVSVTQNRTLIGTASLQFAVDRRIDVRVVVGPGTSAQGKSALVATVTAEDLTAGGGRQVILESHPFLDHDELVAGPVDCHEIPGLYVGVEGQGNGVHVHPLRVVGRECVNPSQFLEPDDGAVTLTHDRLPLGMWAAGGFAAPSLASTCVTPNCYMAGGVVRWDLMLGASNVDLALEEITHVGYALGHTFSSAWSSPSGWLGRADEGPRAGVDPPTCLEEGMCDPDDPSLREPSLLARTNSMGQLETDPFLVAYAREIAAEIATGNRDRFELVVEAITSDPEDEFSVSLSSTVISPSGPCISLRDPSLIPAGQLLDDGFWLFYTCTPMTGPSEIWVTKLSGFLTPTETRTVLEASDLGAYAQGGVSGPEAVASFDEEGRPTIRMWFVARGTLGVVLGLVQGQGSAARSLPTVFQEYTGNPVLTGSAVSLGGCSGECELLGAAVTPRGDNTGGSGAVQTLRFLVARRVNDGSGVSYEMVPLEQLWRNP